MASFMSQTCRLTICPGSYKTGLVYASHPSVMSKSSHFYSHKCLSLYDRLYVHTIYQQSVWHVDTFWSISALWDILGSLFTCILLG
jgi:hypothetical protein